MTPSAPIKRSIRLNDTHTLWVIKEAGSNRVILALNEDFDEDGTVTGRRAIRLKMKQAAALARHLTGISCLPDPRE